MADRIEVAMKAGRPDPAGDSLCKQLEEDLGISVESCRVIDVYTINAALSHEELEKMQISTIETKAIYWALKLKNPNFSYRQLLK